MFEKLTRRAEVVANRLVTTRRGFLARAGRGALAGAGAVGALLAAPRGAKAVHGKECVKDCIIAYCGEHASEACVDAYRYECELGCQSGG